MGALFYTVRSMPSALGGKEGAATDNREGGGKAAPGSRAQETSITAPGRLAHGVFGEQASQAG